MENCTNSTNCSEPVISHDLAGPVFGAFLCVMIVLLILTTISFPFTIAALCLSHTVCKILRIFLINLLAAGLFTALFQLVFGFTALILNFSSVSSPPLQLCRFISWGFGVGSVARMYSLMAFAVSVLLVVRFKRKDIVTVYIVTAILFIWTIPVLLNTHVLIPQVFAVHYYSGVVCFPQTKNAAIIFKARYTFTALWVMGGGVAPFTVSIIVPISVLCYVKHHTLTGEHSSFSKGIARFSLFLVVGNVFNIVGQMVVTLTAYIPGPPGVYVSYLAGAFSLFPTSAMILIFLKPVRMTLKDIVCCKYCPVHPPERL
jgi:hypothetical protein